jgi:hypothetical protein
MKSKEESSITTLPKKDAVDYYVALEMQKREYKEEIVNLQETQDSLFEEVLNNVKEYGNQNLKVSSRRSYGEYPEDILKKEAELKELKALSKRVGNVPYEIKEYLSFVSDPEQGSGDDN